MDLYCKNTENNVREIFRTIDCFCKNTGLKVNYDKTSLYRIGKPSDNKAIAEDYCTHNVKMIDDQINVLGVWVTKDESDIWSLNYEDIIKKMNATLDSWKARKLSIIGKVIVINSLVASLYNYKMYVLPIMPERFIKRIHDAMLAFIWNERRPKVKFNILCASKEQGGLNLVNIKNKDLALKASWIPYLNDDPTLAEMCYESLGVSILKEHIWTTNINEKDVRQNFPKGFWTDVLAIWVNYNFVKEMKSPEEVLNQVIWYNSLIKIDRKIFFWKTPYKKGLLQIKSIVDENGHFITGAQAYDKYNLTTMQFNAIKSAIPKTWKAVIKNATIISITRGTNVHGKLIYIESHLIL